MIAGRNKTKVKTKTKVKKKVPLELSAKICDWCDEVICKAIEVRFACCDECYEVGCEHLVNVDTKPGHAICINGFGCSRPAPK